MAKQKLKHTPEFNIDDTKPELSLIEANATWESHASPAKTLQDALAGVYADTEPKTKRWPLRWTIMGLTAICASFWAIIFYAMFAG